MKEDVQPKENMEDSGSGALTGGNIEAEDVFADAEEWSPIETKLVLWSFIIAGIALIIGLFIVPTSILH